MLVPFTQKTSAAKVHVYISKLRERPFDFYGGQEDFFEKNNQGRDKDKQNRQDDQANQKNIQDGVKKRWARKCQKANGHKLTFDI